MAQKVTYEMSPLEKFKAQSRNMIANNSRFLSHYELTKYRALIDSVGYSELRGRNEVPTEDVPLL